MRDISKLELKHNNNQQGRINHINLICVGTKGAKSK